MHVKPGLLGHVGVVVGRQYLNGDVDYQTDEVKDDVRDDDLPDLDRVELDVVLGQEGKADGVDGFEVVDREADEEHED
ncbi:MAG: hypothetical protein AAFO91_08580 [Bacteroidota bacterium]